MKLTSINNCFLLVIAAALVTGCSLSEPRRTEADFGNSVRNMIAEQTYNPAATAENGTEITSGYSGELGTKTIEVYNTDVAKPKKVSKPISIQIGK